MDFLNSKIKHGKLFIVSAPSGAGKTTLVNALVESIDIARDLSRLITYTSKSPRANERQGIDYHFIGHQDFENKIQEGFFLEWSNAYGAYYGIGATLLDELALGKSFIAVVDRAGAQAIQQKVTGAVLIWIYTKNVLVLRERLHSRGTETLQEIEGRLSLAQKELDEEIKQKLFQYYIHNDLFENSLRELEKIINIYLA